MTRSTRSQRIAALPSCAELDRKLEQEARTLSNNELRSGMRHQGHQVFLVKEIVEYKQGKGYLVHWKGYSAKERTWERHRDLAHTRDLRKMMREARDRAALS